MRKNSVNYIVDEVHAFIGRVTTARSLVLNRSIGTDIKSVTPLEPGWFAEHSTLSRLLSARLGQNWSRLFGRESFWEPIC